MKKITLLFVALMGFAIMAFTQEQYTMFKTVYMKPDYAKLKELGKAMAKHNKEFHNEAPNLASVWVVNSGPHTGNWLYVIGPATFADFDEMTYSDEHKEHWLFEVMPNIEELSEGGFWKQDDDLSYFPENSFTGKEVLAFYHIKEWEGYRFQELLKKVVAVYKEKEYEHFFQVLRPRFDDSNGPDVLIASGFKNWAYFDRDRTFKADYEEVHGENTWWKFMEEFKAVVEGTYDEIIMHVPELSGGGDE